MTDSGVLPLPLRDDPARDRIASELDENFLVEAGAGSGKTTELVGRMVSLVASGSAEVDAIAAVTFTRKAAAELRERFQTLLEKRLLEARDALASDSAEASERGPSHRGPSERGPSHTVPPDADARTADADLVVDRLARALDEIDRAFIGTIHSFCARLLRERPLDVGLDPAFEELPVEERDGLRRRFWEAYLERLARDSDPLLEELARAGLSPSTLFGLFDRVVENPDVDFPTDQHEAPSLAETGEIRAELERLVDRARELMDDVPPVRGWDSLQKKLRSLHFEREVTGWSEPRDLFEAIAVLCKPAVPHKTTFNRWRDTEMTRQLVADVNAFGVGDTPAHRLVDRWYAHRYALAIRLCRAAARAFEEHRIRTGRLDFQDLLVLAARLLRENPTVRGQLGRRYRRLLVDEFQDTDPLQAEIMLLLSSEPDPAGPEGGGARGRDQSGSATGGAEGRSSGADDGRSSGADDADWRVQTPRPGALFVVGDPKQSIYRFRRADIQLYSFVRERFEDFGSVLSLSTNFRSRPPIGDIVNDVFASDDFFPDRATPEQAAFERLDTRPPSAAVPCEGVFAYFLDPEASNKSSAAEDDAARLATWIRARVDSGERRPEDFLILTRGRGQLAAYARGLEAHSLPVQVTGAGVGVETEIHELGVVLECMIDPANPVKVVAALVGLFFGIDYERLVQHRLDGGSLDAMVPGDRGHPEVVAGLRRLHAWWRAGSNEPADVFIARLVSELGLLPFAAAGELGTLRAGALLYGLDAVRAAALAGDTSLPGALEALRAALALREAEAPLEPGRPDAIRLMNLHQAKGLEGTVVVLADPTDHSARRPDAHLTRTRDGAARGFLRVSEERGGFRGSRDLARPAGWAEHEELETRFDAAEEVRLLYVAVTRAREELVVARWPEGRGSSAWSPLDAWLDEHAEVLELEAREPAEREELEPDPEAVRSALREIDGVLAARGRPTSRHASVTSVTKPDAGPGGRPAGNRRFRLRSDAEAPLRGYSWGSAVHGALALAAADPGDEPLRAGCRDLLVEHERPLDERGEPVELDELLALVRAVRGSAVWTRARAADRMLVEVPFAVAGLDTREAVETEPAPDEAGRTGRPQLDLFGGEAASQEPSAETAPPGEEDVPTVLEGVVDLAFRERGGWVIADYKTDVGTDPDFRRRAEGYRRQVDLYARAWTKLTGEPVKERVLFWTAQGRVESW